MPAVAGRCQRAGDAGNGSQDEVMKIPIINVEIRYEHDVVLSRQRARQIAELLGFDRLEQVQIATAVSEIARNAFQYAQRGKVEFGDGGWHQARVQDRHQRPGPGHSAICKPSGTGFINPRPGWAWGFWARNG